MGNIVDRRGFIAGMGAVAGLSFAGLTGCSPSNSSEGKSNVAFGTVPSQWDDEADVVVVGGGAAGFMAAFAVLEKGSSAILLEKTNSVGGDTSISEQAILGLWPQKTLEVHGMEDSFDSFMNDWEQSHKWSNKGDAGEPLPEEHPYSDRHIEKCAEMFNWLDLNCSIEWMGGSLSSLAVMPQPIWDTVPRSWIALNGLIPQFQKKATSAKLPVLTKHEAQDLIVNEEGRVIGVSVLENGTNRMLIKARKGVVLATGTFCANPFMI